MIVNPQELSVARFQHARDSRMDLFLILPRRLANDLRLPLILPTSFIRLPDPRYHLSLVALLLRRLSVDQPAPSGRGSIL